MADFLKFSKFVLIILAILVTHSLMPADATSRNEKRSIAGALRSRSVTKTGDVMKTGMTLSEEDGSTVFADGSRQLMEQHFLRRLGMEAIPLRRSKRSMATEDAIPGYLSEILRKFQRQTRKNWNPRKQKDKETIVTGVVPYRVFSINSKTVKVYFHLSAVLKLESIALTEVVVRQPHAATLNEREGRIDFRSLAFCRETEVNDSCQSLAHAPVTRRRHFDIYDVTRSVQELQTELSMSSDGGNCVGCSIIMTLVRQGANELISSSSDVLLVVSNEPISDPGLSENSVGTERRLKNGRFDRIERGRAAEDPKVAVELRDTNKMDSRRQRREVTCALSGWYLDFAKLGWNTWIRFPLGYYANYCSGSCISPSSTNPGGNMTNHAFVKGLYRRALQNEVPLPQATIDALPAACCVPVRLSPINILYRNDDENWIIRGMNEMVADQCACL